MAAALLAAACGDSDGAAGSNLADAAIPVDAPPGCEQSIGTFVAEHACLHAASGPIRDLTADTSSISPSADASRPHTAFRIALPAQDGGYRGALRYMPLRSGELAMFTSAGVTAELFDETGQAVAARLSHDVASCSDLGRVTTFQLRGGSTYSLVLSATATAEAFLIVEALDEFLPSEAYSAVCELADAGPADAGQDDATTPDNDAGADATPGPDAACTPQLGITVVDHTCLHVMQGPFDTVTAQADPATATVGINGSHTYYTVNLLADADLYTGVVTYRPTNTGRYVFFLNPDTPARMQDASGAPVPIVHTQLVSTCPGITRALIVDLTVAVRYRLIFEPTAEAAPRVAVEYMDGFLPEEQWEAACAP